MARYPSSVRNTHSDQSRAKFSLGTKCLELLLLGHIVFLSLAQAVTQVIAPAANRPVIPAVRILRIKDNGVRKKRTLRQASSNQDPPTNQAETLLESNNDLRQG